MDAAGFQLRVDLRFSIFASLILLFASATSAKEPEARVSFYVPDADISTSTIKEAKEVANSGNSEERRTAMEFFAWQARKYAEEAADEIIGGLSDSDASVRSQAAVAFRNLKSLSPEETDRQLTKLWNRDRFAGAIAKAYLGIANEPVAKELLAGLQQPEPLQDDAAGGFKVLGTSAAVIVLDGLIRLIDSEDKDLSCTAMMVLAETRSAPASLASRMRDWIRRGRYCDWQAAAVLGAIGPPAAEAVPELVGRISGKVGECCSWDAEYLVSIGTASVPALLSTAREADAYRRAWAAYALAQLSDKDDRARDAALKALDDPESEVRIRAQSGLEKLGPRSKAIARALFHRILGFEKVWKSDNLQYEVWPGNALKVLIPALPIEPEDLFRDLPRSDLHLTLEKSTSTVDRSHAIDLKLTFKNTASQPIRLLKTDCAVTLADPVELIIFQDTGWLILRRNFRWHSSPKPRADAATVLQAGESASFRCMLQEEAASDRRFGDEPWAFDYDTVGLGKASPKLTPGRYKIWAHYRLKGRLAQAQAEASPKGLPDLLWEGDAFSTALQLEIK